MNTLSVAQPAIRGTRRLSSTVSMLALAAAVTVLGMFATFLLTGVGQDALQFIHSPDEYVALLLRNPPALRIVVGLDNLFIVLYSSMFLALGSLLWRHWESSEATLCAYCAV